MFELAIVFPIEVVEGQPCTMLVRIVPVRLASPHVAPRNGVGIRIAEDLRAVEAFAVLRIPRAIEAKPVLDVLVIQSVNDHGIDVAGAELVGERYLDHRLLLAEAKEDERARG